MSPTTGLTTTAHHSIDDDVNNTGDDSDSIYGTGRTRYLALKERRNRLARSRSSHTMANDDDNDSTHLDEPVSPTTANPNAYLASRCDFVSFVNMYKSKKKCLLLRHVSKKTKNRWKSSSRENLLKNHKKN